MSHRPTPETDDAQHEGLLRGNPMPTQVVHVNFARKLESERDEVREHLSAVKHFLNKYITERDEWSAMCGRYKQERDEARKVLREIEAARLYAACELRMIATRALEAKHDPVT